MPSAKTIHVPFPVARGTRWVMISGKPVLIRSKIGSVRQTLIQGRGSRFTVRYRRYLTPDLAVIKARQIRAERKAGIRVGYGLFDNPLSERPVVIGVVKPQRKRQQHPASGKRIRPRRGSSRRGSSVKHSKRKFIGLPSTALIRSDVGK